MSTNVQRRERLDFIDTHRGLAVLLMLLMHSADGWLQPGLKQPGTSWDVIRGLGGLAAPTFLLLAGLSMGLSWATSAQVQPRAEIARGLGLIGLGYGLRLQMWMLDAGGYKLPVAWAATLLLLAGGLLGYRALRGWEREEPNGRKYAGLALVSAAAGLLLVAQAVPERFFPLLRVDVLQAIGASLVILSWLGPKLRQRPLLGLGLAAATALITPWMRSWVPGPLPVPIAGYLAHFTVGSGQPLPTLFPLFPWMAYALAGATLGLALGAAQKHGVSAKTLALRWSAMGLGVALLCCEPLPPAHALLNAQPWLEPLVRAGYRIGASLVLLALAVGLGHPRVPLAKSLRNLGRASLFVYWVHLEFTFGTLAKPFVRSLDFFQLGVGLALLTVLMTLLSNLWLHVRRLRPLRDASEAVQTALPNV